MAKAKSKYDSTAFLASVQRRGTRSSWFNILKEADPEFAEFILETRRNFKKDPTLSRRAVVQELLHHKEYGPKLAVGESALDQFMARDDDA